MQYSCEHNVQVVRATGRARNSRSELRVSRVSLANLSPSVRVAFSQSGRGLINYLYIESHKKTKLVAA